MSNSSPTWFHLQIYNFCLYNNQTLYNRQMSALQAKYCLNTERKERWEWSIFGVIFGSGRGFAASALKERGN